MKGEFYKMYYENWDEGTEGLSLEQEAAFLRLCNLMYRRQVSVMIPHMQVLAGIWRCRTEKAKRLLQSLIDATKITQTDDGKISNQRVSDELHARGIERVSKKQAGHLGGVSSGQTRRAQAGSSEEYERSIPPVCDPHTTSMRGVYDEYADGIRPVCDEYASSMRGVYDAHTPHIPGVYDELETDKPLKSNESNEAPASMGAKQNEAIREEKRREEERVEKSREEKKRISKKERKQDSCTVAHATRTSGEPSGFDVFWNLYPKRDGGNPRKPAASKFKTAITQGATVEEILIGAGHFARDMLARNRVGTRFVPMAKAWLEQAVWREYQVPAPPPVGDPHNVVDAADELIADFDSVFGPNSDYARARAAGVGAGPGIIRVLPARTSERSEEVCGSGECDLE